MECSLHRMHDMENVVLHVMSLVMGYMLTTIDASV